MDLIGSGSGDRDARPGPHDGVCRQSAAERLWRPGRGRTGDPRLDADRGIPRWGREWIVGRAQAERASPARRERRASGSGGTSSTGSGSARGSKVGAANAGSGSGARGGASKGGSTSSKGGATSRAPRSRRATGVVGGSVSAYVYPTSQGSIPSASPLSGISSGGVLLLIGILATLALVAVLTLRLSRLQS